jgi:hypothetical protein
MTETGDDANSESEMGDLLDPSMMESGGQSQVRLNPTDLFRDLSIRKLLTQKWN